AVLALSGRPADIAQGRELVAAIDARMGEVYVGRFGSDADGLVTSLGAEVLVAPDAAIANVPFDALGIGTGFAAAGGVLAARLGLVDVHPSALPHAADLARLAARDFIRGHAIAADVLEPTYLRDRVALTLVEQGKA
ncbi:MAG: tRNA (adenosine(37)-N6)-threonylcarbamoyltransferase complex dimerization subunit type 1 TsaB, partial [Arenimonas sp.]